MNPIYTTTIKCIGKNKPTKGSDQRLNLNGFAEEILIHFLYTKI